ncbi:MAG: hypothetical protein JNK60_11495 [Acidobacteria bacterium]|nr:hypothetical protein [Acidobacteriota bacterium]
MSARAVRRTLVLALALAGLLPIAVRRAVKAYERALPSNAVHRALESLRRGDDDGARREARQAATQDLAVSPWERRAAAQWTSALAVPAHLELSRELLARGLSAEARATAWKALRHGHRRSLLVEDLAPWQALATCFAKDGDALRLSGVLGVVSEESDGARAELLALGARDAVPAPVEARPPDLEATGFRPLPHEGRPPPALREEGNVLVVLRAGLVKGTLDLERAVPELRLACASETVIGLAAIVLVSVDDGEAVPLRVSAPGFASYRVHGPLAPGRHRVSVELLDVAHVPRSPEARILRILGAFTGGGAIDSGP